MNPRSKKLALSLVAAGSVVAAGGAVAAVAGHGKQQAATPVANGILAASRSGGTPGTAHDGLRLGHRGGHLDAAVAYLGITEDALRTALQSGKTLAQVAAATPGKSRAGLVDALVADEKKELAAALTAGRLTQAQADTLSANLATRVGNLVDGKAGPGLRLGGGPFGHGGRGGHLANAATYLGTTEAKLQADLRAGKTLAQVAQATPGKTVAGLVAALVASEKKELVAAVAAGRLTPAQSDSIAAGLEARFTSLVNGTLPQRGPGDHGGFGGNDGFRGPGGFGGPPEHADYRAPTGTTL